MVVLEDCENRRLVAEKYSVRYFSPIREAVHSATTDDVFSVAGRGKSGGRPHETNTRHGPSVAPDEGWGLCPGDFQPLERMARCETTEELGERGGRKPYVVAPFPQKQFSFGSQAVGICR